MQNENNDDKQLFHSLAAKKLKEKKRKNMKKFLIIFQNSNKINFFCLFRKWSNTLSANIDIINSIMFTMEK